MGALSRAVSVLRNIIDFLYLDGFRAPPLIYVPRLGACIEGLGPVGTVFPPISTSPGLAQTIFLPHLGRSCISPSPTPGSSGVLEMQFPYVGSGLWLLPSSIQHPGRVSRSGPRAQGRGCSWSGVPSLFLISSSHWALPGLEELPHYQQKAVIPSDYLMSPLPLNKLVPCRSTD